MNWWAWCILGFVLFGIEISAIDAQFYLVFAGLAAVVVGLVGWLGIELPVYVQWLLFAVLAVTSMFTVRGRIRAKLMGASMAKVNSDVDKRVVVTEDLAPGGSCRLEYRGSGWNAVNVGERTIARGSAARIDSVDGLTLRLRAL